MAPTPLISILAHFLPPKNILHREKLPLLWTTHTQNVRIFHHYCVPKFLKTKIYIPRLSAVYIRFGKRHLQQRDVAKYIHYPVQWTSTLRKKNVSSYRNFLRILLWCLELSCRLYFHKRKVYHNWLQVGSDLLAMCIRIVFYMCIVIYNVILYYTTCCCPTE